MWLYWVIFAIVAAIGEVVTMDLFLASVAAGALLAALVALALPGVGIAQVAAFSSVSLLGIGVVRPAVKRMSGTDNTTLHSGRIKQSDIVGKRATVTSDVDAGSGQIRIGQGEFWTARSFNPDETIAVGTSVEVLLVDGLAALVAPAPSRPSLQIEPNSLDQKGQ